MLRSFFPHAKQLGDFVICPFPLRWEDLEPAECRVRFLKTSEKGQSAVKAQLSSRKLPARLRSALHPVPSRRLGDYFLEKQTHLRKNTQILTFESSPVNR